MTIVYFIEGNVATGKSTMLDLLQEHVPNCQTIKEPLNMWRNIRDTDGTNILDHFYQTPHKIAYAFQSLAFFSRAKVLKQIDFTRDVVFVERSVESDKLFAKNCYESNLITELEWKLYLMWFEWITEELLPLPNGTKIMHIYLRCSPQTAHERLQTRDRKEEHSVDLSYLRDIHRQHEQCFTRERTDVIIFDAHSCAEELANQIVHTCTHGVESR